MRLSPRDRISISRLTPQPQTCLAIAAYLRIYLSVGAIAFSPAGDAARGFVFTGCIAALIQIIFLSANHPVAASMPKTYVMLTVLYAVGAFFAYVVTLWTVSE